MALPPDEEARLGSVGVPTQGILRIPGPTWESAKMAQTVLQDNHVKYDWTFTDDGSGLHNHLSHAILAAYSLGASADAIKDIYDLQSRTQKAMCPILNIRINYQNWTRWLGKDEYYSSYLVFFTDEIAKYGAANTIERYLFRFKEGLVLLRTVSGALHPLIQIGHGVEFGLDALVAEGLAQACVHSAGVARLFPTDWPNGSVSATSSPLVSAFSRLSAFKPSAPPSPSFAPTAPKDSFTATAQRLDPSRPRHPRLGLSGFTILSHILNDDRLSAGHANQIDDFPRLNKAIEKRGDLIRAWCEEWVVDEAGGWVEVVNKMEELFWIAAILVGASSRPGYKPRMDFFMMHSLTSALFMPGLLEVLSPSSRIQLLHSHFRVMIAYWVSRGRPHLYIKEVLMAATAYPQPPNAPAYADSAIQRAIKKQKEQEAREEEERLKKKLEQSRHSPTNENGLDNTAHQANGITIDTSGKIPRRDSDASQVEISLDSPADNVENHIPQPYTAAHDDQEDEVPDESALRTPRRSLSLSNGHIDERPKQQPSSSSVWAGLITSAVDHSDEHVTKMIRSLAFCAQNFGLAPPGVYKGAIPGTDAMDGTIFVRLAGMLMNAMGWEHEGQKAGDWDRSVLGFDEAWQDETRTLANGRADKGKGRADN